MQCAHHLCTCRVESDASYCAPTCRTGIGGLDAEVCYCGHDACEASTGNA